MRGPDERLAFNRGITSPRALARTDLKRNALAAEIQSNWMPRAMGSMMLRPGTRWLGAGRPAFAWYMPGKPVLIPFVFSSSEKAIIEMTDQRMRVWVDDTLLARSQAFSVIQNPSFDTNLDGWTDQDDAGAASTYEATLKAIKFIGNGTAYAWRQQLVTLNGLDLNKTLAIRLHVTRGSINLRVGNTSKGNEVLSDTTLNPGWHSITVRSALPALYVQVRTNSRTVCLLDSVAIEGDVAFELPTPYLEADLGMIRWQQSGDVVFLACDGYAQKRIERRPDGSWSIADYVTEDGPFRIRNVSATTITPSGQLGDITLTASQAVFTPGHVGALWQITSGGQLVETDFTASGSSEPIRVTGVGVARNLTWTVAGTFVGRAHLQRATSDEGPWITLPGGGWNTPNSNTYNDGLDNQIVWYRFAVFSGNYTSGTIETTLNYPNGSVSGVVRITGYTSPTLVDAAVVKRVGNSSATENWAEGLWSDRRGYPSAVAIHDGRLWWAGRDRFVGSVTDAYSSFDPTFEGDAGPIIRTIGFGPVDSINWMVSLGRLIAGTFGMELSCKSSSLDEPLTPTAFNPRKVGTQGSAPIAAVDIDSTALFVQRGGRRIYEIASSINNGNYDYANSDVTQMCPDLLKAGVRKMVVQRQPDTRVHCLLNDGSVAILIFDRAENLVCWVTYETDGIVQDAVVLPGLEEDAVYYAVLRNGEYLLERWATEDECSHATDSRLLDSHCHYAGTTFVYAPHLIGKEVVIYADGVERFRGVLDNGGVYNFGETVSTAIIGLPYEARFKSSRLAYVIDQGVSTFGAKKNIHQVALVLLNTSIQGIQFGQSFDRMDSLPLVNAGRNLGAGAFLSEYEEPAATLPGTWTTDARLCLRAASPHPCTVAAAVINMTGNGK